MVRVLELVLGFHFLNFIRVTACPFPLPEPRQPFILKLPMKNSPFQSLGLAAAALSAALTASCASFPKPAPKARTVILSIDALQPDFYRTGRYETPNLHRLAAQGASADSVEVIYPSVTYPVHSTLVTGAPIASHGVLSNRVFNWETGPTYDWYWDASNLKVPALWDLVTKSGRKVALLGWPVTVGAHADWVVPEVFPPLSFDPGEVWDRTVKVTKPGLLAELPPGPFKDTLDRDRWFGLSAARLLDRHSPDLLLLHYSHVDVVQHLQGPATPAFIRGLTDVDALLGELVTHLDLSRDCLMIVGDHGFAPVTRKIRINALFKQAGWLQELPFRTKDWKIVAFTNGGQAAIYLKDRSIKKRALQLLRKHAPGNYRILDRKALDRMETLPGAWLALEPEDGVAIAQEVKEPVEEKYHGPHGEHGYLPGKTGMETGFIAAGACAQPGRELGRMSIYDVAATLAAQVGVRLGSERGRPAQLR